MPKPSIRLETEGPGTPDVMPTVDFRAFIRRLWNGRYIIALCGLIALAIGLFIVHRMEPAFTASSHVLLAADERPVADSSETVVAESLSDQKLATEVEIIYSTAILGAVVDELGLAEDFELAEAGPEPEPSGFGRLIEPILSMVGPAEPPVTDPGSSADPEAIERPTPSPRRMAIDYLREFLAVSRVSESRVITLAFTAPDPDTAATVANAIATQYIRDQTSARQEARKRQVEWLSRRVEALRADIQSTEDALEQKRAELTLESGQGLDITRRQLDARAQELSQAQGETARLSLVHQQLVQALEGDELPDTIAEFRDSEQMTRLRVTSEELNDRLRGLAEDSPVRRLLQVQISDVERNIREEAVRITSGVGEDLEAARAREALLRATVRDLESQAMRQTRAGLDLRQLEMDAEVARQNYEDTLRELLRVSGRAESVPSDIRILTKAEPPEFEDSRRGKLIVAFSLLSGLLAGAGIVVLRDQLDDSFGSVDDLEAATGLRLLGGVPEIVHRRGTGLLDQLRDRPDPKLAEALRSLCASIIELFPGQPGAVLLFASSGADEGRTELAVLTALRLRKLGRKVVLVDCDMRASTVADILEAGGGRPGLYAVLAGHVALESAIHVDPTTKLQVVPAGMEEKENEDAADVFYRDSFRDLLATLRSRYEFVILDVPPVLDAADARIAAPLADAILLVVRANRTSRSLVAKAMSELSAPNTRFGGAILTAVRTRGR